MQAQDQRRSSAPVFHLSWEETGESGGWGDGVVREASVGPVLIFN